MIETYIVILIAYVIIGYLLLTILELKEDKERLREKHIVEYKILEAFDETVFKIHNIEVTVEDTLVFNLADDFFSSNCEREFYNALVKAFPNNKILLLSSGGDTPIGVTKKVLQ